LGSFLVLELTAFEMGGLEKDFFDIGWNLTTKGLKQSFGWVRIINQLGSILMKQSQQVFQLGFDFCR
jgi:hypothetical protein